MATYVINEWLWADLSGVNGKKRQLESFTFLDKLAISEDTIVTIEGSAFDRKAWSLCKDPDPLVQRIAAFYVGRIRQNSDRCRILHPEDVRALPNDLASRVKNDDHYLIEAQLSVPDATVVTTDEPLQQALLGANLDCRLRSEFLADYGIYKLTQPEPHE
jgi:hypothetical protein